jgi:putative spermidine/putrescine transport system permease protein
MDPMTRRPARTGGPVRARRRRTRSFRIVVVVLVGAFFLLPLYAMAEFTTRPQGSAPGISLAAWDEILRYPDLLSGIGTSVQLAIITAVATMGLLAPTLIWVRLRLPRLQRVLEAISLLPLTIPAIVLVVGLAPVYLWVTYLLGNSPLTLAFAYLILAMPYTFRAIDAGLGAIDVVTLAEAARSLGGRWSTVIVRVIMPNITGALLNAAMLAVALVIGEFTIASLLSFQTLQTEIFTLGRLNAPVSVAVALLSLMISFALLFLITFIGARRRPSQEVS